MDIEAADEHISASQGASVFQQHLGYDGVHAFIVQFHKTGAKAYLTLNIFAFNDDIFK